MGGSAGEAPPCGLRSRRVRLAPANAAIWGKWACRRQSGPPWRASRLIRCAVDSAPPASCSLRLAAIPSAAAFAAESPPGPDAAEGPDMFEAYLAAFLALDRHELAAMALTLGILCFAVVTAILLVRTRARLVDTEAAARDESIAAKAAVDRAYALLLAEPQILVAWAAGSDHPEIIGDPALIAAPGEPQRILAFGTWLRPDRAAEMERSVDALRARGQSFELTVTTLERPHRRGRRAGDRRPRHPAAARSHRRQVRAGRAGAAPPQADRRNGRAAGADRRHAVAGLGARRRRQAQLRQRRLRARGRGQEQRRRGRARHRAVRRRGAQRNPARARERRPPMRAACRR